ncbi:response regulator [Devosia sp.]|uniref:response regulator n=1 Tax=Devosia sp. TaxID=1871048 RepID=UPI003A94B084
MSCRVLVVEDEIFVATELESILEDMGHEPIGIAADSRSALELGKQAEIAFVDLNLVDGATGIDVGRKLADGGVTVVYMTANPAQLGQGVPGTVGVIPKPVTDSEIKQAVDYAVALFKQQNPAPNPPSRLKLFSLPVGGSSGSSEPLAG